MVIIPDKKYKVVFGDNNSSNTLQLSAVQEMTF